MDVRISARVREKLELKHGVTPLEVYQCFLNRDGPSFRDNREDHETDPPTQWFIAETDHGRKLKVVYVQYPDFFAIKSAFEPTQKWVTDYETLCVQHS
ncbi:ADP-ribosyl-(dinitrogen reductase) hydrolase [Xanthomonas sp. 3498]|uniref:ADP-ribosyl-(dinitrogen reductase) hydrolase n=1 Tax=Xanthomonas sp. 3498 TaxID=2663863 RepID=UPI00161ADB26|nr:ADP-ribosyl-(dinitrogen reductase) hydrolase [Xanthomonas sp. 3498]MBB5875876.1 hypothetical protein [Xanthomonas sp. 3498]